MLVGRKNVYAAPQVGLHSFLTRHHRGVFLQSMRLEDALHAASVLAPDGAKIPKIKVSTLLIPEI